VIALNVPAFRAFDLTRWFFYRDSYADLDAAEWWAWLARLGFIVLAVVLSAAFLALTPRRETFFSTFGQATMYVYLLHTFVLYPLRESGVLRGEHASGGWLIGMVLASIAISFALASPLVRRVFRPLVEPKLRWLYGPTADLPEESRPTVAAPRVSG
ncbi:MAG TPA: fucose 4-O-acetylase, partial [Pseudolysinimonas sp.]|nr:fucose 4-O-acetylase [Pseudolysinimonas sp.]